MFSSLLFTGDFGTPSTTFTSPFWSLCVFLRISVFLLSVVLNKSVGVFVVLV